MPPPRRLPRARCRLIFVMGLLEMMMLTNPFSALPRNYFSTTLADPPWRFTNKTGKVAPEHVRLHRYHTMTLEEIMTLPVRPCRPAPQPRTHGVRGRCHGSGRGD